MATLEDKKKELEMNQRELNEEIKVHNFFKLFGIEQHLKYVLSPLNNNPTVTFKVETKEELINFIELVKPSLLPFFIRKDGSIYFEPIRKTDIFEDNENSFKSKGLFKIDTKSDKYNNFSFKVVCWIERNKNQYFQLWLEAPLSVLDSESYFYKTIVDKYETDIAKSYNSRHENIMTRVPVIRDLDLIKFYGGKYSHFAKTEEENKTLNKLLGVKE